MNGSVAMYAAAADDAAGDFLPGLTMGSLCAFTPTCTHSRTLLLLRSTCSLLGNSPVHFSHVSPLEQFD